jgi:Amt family ammonium transporter
MIMISKPYRILAALLLGTAVAVGTSDIGWAQEAAATTEAAAAAAPAPPTVEELKELLDTKAQALDTVWVMVTAFLVFWMQAGFALVEAGLTRAKNVVNICMKNLLDLCFGSVAYWLVGFGLMFGAGSAFMGQSGFMLQHEDPNVTYASLSWANVPLEAKFFFQLVFAATTATIVSGAMAERTKFVSYMVYSFFVSLLIYPISGHWIWGGGWLANLGTYITSVPTGFWDFAGSTVVHSLGGWLALVGALIIGPRIGKYDPVSGKARAIPGHNLLVLCLGVFILWLGWFGFNPGSTMAAVPADIAHVTCTTNAAAALGCVASLVTAKIMFGKWEGTMALNGALAGLVGVTAGCYWVTIPGAMIIGAVAGVLVVLSVVFFDQVAKIDDPVGAISVHGVCGAWGTLAVGLFSTGTGEASPMPGLFYGGGMTQLIAQFIGVIAVMAWGFVTGFILFMAVKYSIGLRVTAEEEREGLDIGEHGNEAYHGFQFVEGL